MSFVHFWACSKYTQLLIWWLSKTFIPSHSHVIQLRMLVILKIKQQKYENLFHQVETFSPYFINKITFLVCCPSFLFFQYQKKIFISSPFGPFNLKLKVSNKKFCSQCTFRTLFHSPVAQFIWKKVSTMTFLDPSGCCNISSFSLNRILRMSPCVGHGLSGLKKKKKFNASQDRKNKNANINFNVEKAVSFYSSCSLNNLQIKRLKILLELKHHTL